MRTLTLLALALAMSACGSGGKVTITPNGGTVAGNARKQGVPGAGSELVLFSIVPEKASSSGPPTRLGYLDASSTDPAPAVGPMEIGDSGRIDSALAAWSGGGRPEALFVKNGADARDTVSAVNFQDLSTRDLVTSPVPIQAIAGDAGHRVAWLDAEGRIYVQTVGGASSPRVEIPLQGREAVDLRFASDHSLIVQASRQTSGNQILIFSVTGARPRLVTSQEAADLDLLPGAEGGHPSAAVVERARSGRDQLVLHGPGRSSKVLADGPAGTIHEPRWSPGGLLAYWQDLGKDWASVRVLDPRSPGSSGSPGSPRSDDAWEIMALSPLSALSGAVCLAWSGEALFFSGLLPDRSHVIMRSQRQGNEWHTAVFARPAGGDGAVCPHVAR